MKRIAVIVAAACCCLLLIGAAHEVAPVMPTKGFYVNDYATAVFAEHRAAILTQSGDLYIKTGAQVVVLTIKSLDDWDIDAYTKLIMHDWEIGGVGGENGVLIFVERDSGASKIMVGPALQEVLPDSFLNGLYEEKMQPFYKDGNFSKGIFNGYTAIVEKLYAKYGFLPENPQEPAPEQPAASPGFQLLAGKISPPVVIVLILLILLRMVRVNRKYKNKYGKPRIVTHRSYQRVNLHREDDLDLNGFGGPGRYGDYDDD